VGEIDGNVGTEGRKYGNSKLHDAHFAKVMGSRTDNQRIQNRWMITSIHIKLQFYVSRGSHSHVALLHTHLALSFQEKYYKIKYCLNHWRNLQYQPCPIKTRY